MIDRQSREDSERSGSGPLWGISGAYSTGGGFSPGRRVVVELPGGGALMLGNFINAVLNFLIMAFAVFCLVKAVNRLHRKKEETPPPPPKPSREEVLLTEIRDLLKERV